jgi:hypothetical protein
MTLTVAFLMAVGYGGRPPSNTRFSRKEAAGLVVYVTLLIAFVAMVLSG